MTRISLCRGILSGMAVVAVLALTSSSKAYGDEKDDKIAALTKQVEALKAQLCAAEVCAAVKTAPSPDEKPFGENQNLRLKCARLVCRGGHWCVRVEGWRRKGTEVQLTRWDGMAAPAEACPTYLLCSVEPSEMTSATEEFVENIEVKPHNGLIILQERKASHFVSTGDMKLKEKVK